MPPTTGILLRIRARLQKEGWDNGPKSIWFAWVDIGEFGTPGPRAPGGDYRRILSAVGAVKANPRKQPRTARLRFARSVAMEKWQLDALDFRLFYEDRTKVTIYQLIDDSFRFYVGAECFADPENGTGAIATLEAAFADRWVPKKASCGQLQFPQSRTAGQERMESPGLSRRHGPGTGLGGGRSLEDQLQDLREGARAGREACSPCRPAARFHRGPTNTRRI